MKYRFWSCAFFLVSILFVTSALAQENVAQIEQSRQFRDPVPNLRPLERPSNTDNRADFTAASPGDDDLGQQIILKSRKEYQPITASMSTGITFTNNVGLSAQFSQEDWLWQSGLNVSYEPRFSNYAQGFLGISAEAFRYDEFNEFDFESTTLSAGIDYHLQYLGGLNAGLRFDYNRLTSDFGEEIFSNRAATITLSKIYIINRAQYFYTSANVALSWSDPARAARNEYLLSAGYRLQVTRGLNMSLLMRLGYYEYTETSREDSNEVLQISTGYSVTQWLTANASLSYGFNQSNRTGFDYEVLNGSLGIFLSWKF